MFLCKVYKKTIDIMPIVVRSLHFAISNGRHGQHEPHCRSSSYSEQLHYSAHFNLSKNFYRSYIKYNFLK
ncbi:hypothetical protein MBOVa_3870 [Mycoplasmopsis bovis 8790]|nr:hypothetical protein MBOVa_3870 [Mycoplasmopsis bovis 8790]